MKDKLLSDKWTDLDSAELRLLLDERIGRPGQYDGGSNNRDKLCLPLGGTACRIALTFRDKRIVAIEPGPAFDASQWKRICEEVEKSILTGPINIGREYSFSSYRVSGSWRGEQSRLQILPPPDDAPRAPVEMAEHPFILEFPIKASAFWPVTNHRRIREHRKLTLLLNVLLAGRTSLQPRRFDHVWASVPGENGAQEIKWVQQFFFAKLGDAVQDKLSSPAAERLEELDPDAYSAIVGYDGKSLRLPADLDQWIFWYMQLLPPIREKFDRAAFWMDMASRQWNISTSLSFAALVSAVESLTERGRTHHYNCPVCGGPCQHESPGATEKFRAFFERYASGTSLRSRRNEMYKLRSGILHGSELMQLDQDLAFGWDPPWWNERELHEELWSLTRVALRNWLKNASNATGS